MIKMTSLPPRTLSVITFDDKIILGKKRRGFGKGLYNGFGGKPHEDESLVDCLIRETKEEAKITLFEEHLSLAGVLDFYFVHHPDWDQQVHVYKTSSYEGIPRKTEEMVPKIFPLHKIPYNRMWPDDRLWLPPVLNGKLVRAAYTFHEEDTLVSIKQDFVDEFSDATINPDYFS